MMAESLPDQAHESVQQGSAEWETVAAQDRRSRYAVAAPEVIHDSEEKIVDYSKSLDVPEVAQIETPLYFVRHNDDPNNGLEVTPSLEQPRHVRKILGLGPKTFWLLVIVAIVVIAAAIGGGVGGSIAVKNQRNASLTADAVGSSLPTITPSPTSLSPTEESATTSSASSTFTPEPIGFSMQVFSGFNRTGLSQTINETGYFQLAFPAHSYVWLPGRWNNNTRCSVGFCAGDISLGWRGMTETYSEGNRTATRYMDGVIIECARDFAWPDCPSPIPKTPQTVPAVTPPATATTTLTLPAGSSTLSV